MQSSHWGLWGWDEDWDLSFGFKALGHRLQDLVGSLEGQFCREVNLISSGLWAWVLRVIVG